MYCDYSSLSRDFTLSFRKMNLNFSQIKKRNQNISLSKILRNTIWNYGQSYEFGRGLLTKLRDEPFYCGMILF